MGFYTNVTVQGDNVLHRFVDDAGNRRKESVRYSPSLYVRSQDVSSEYQTLKGIPLKRVQYDTIRDAKEFVNQMKGMVPDVIHGVVDFQLQFIHEKYAAGVKYDVEKIKRFFVDIEVFTKKVLPEFRGKKFVDVASGKVVADRDVAMLQQNRVLALDGKEMRVRDVVYSEFPSPTKAEHEVDAITVYDSTKKKYYVFSTVMESWKPPISGTLYVHCKDERELLSAFVSFWERDHPDILTGWNVEGFDVPYLVNRIVNLFGEATAKKLSPWGKIVAKTGTNSFGQDFTYYDISGIDTLDYLDLYKKFTIKNRESYKLGYIASIELSVSKVEYEGTLADFSIEDPTRFLDYNLKDVELVVRMDEKLQLIMLACSVAYLMMCPISDSMGTVRPWTSKVMYELGKKNVHIDAYHRQAMRPYEGGYVKAPLVGKYGWVVSYDFTSLYPHLMMAFNIGPESKLEYHELPDLLKPYYRQNLVDMVRLGNVPQDVIDCLVKHDLAMASNGMFYRRDKESVVSYLVREVFLGRKAKKQEMLGYKREKEANKDRLDEADLERLEKLIRSSDVMQGAFKVAANSFYGALANIHFPLFDVDNAEAITLSGQSGIRYMSDGMSKYVSRLSGVERDYVITIDTDSSYIDLSTLTKKVGIANTPTPEAVDIVTRFADSKMKDESKRLAEEYHTMTNVRSRCLDFKREKVIFGGVWVAKKRYIAQVFDSEGVRYKDPDLSITGLETNRSSTPQLVRERLTEAFDVVVNSDEEDVHKFVEKFYQEYMRVDPADIAFPRGVNNVEQFYDKNTLFKSGTPIHVRASLVFNHLLDKHGLASTYHKIRSGDKIKFIMLREPNPTRGNVIGWIDSIPEEFGVKEYIDYEEMFEKSFVSPLQGVLNVIGWKARKESSLDSFFC